jgi:hypothetical protein
MGGLAIYGLFGFSSNAQIEVPAQFVCFGIGDPGALPVFCLADLSIPGHRQRNLEILPARSARDKVVR